MSESISLALVGTLLAAGVAGSLHCVGMCGPILLAFSQAVGGRASGSAGGPALRAMPARDFVAYHAGRIWTYALLGLLAGILGGRVRAGAALFGWQRPVALLAGVVVLLAGLLLLGVLPGGRVETWLAGCGAGRLRGLGWFATLASSPDMLPRFLLGALMGFLPCGLVYAMLALVATLPTPAHAAAAMLVFGLGTVPSLTAVLLFGRSISGWMRRHGTRLVAATLLIAGGVMLQRALTSPAGHAVHAGPDAAAGAHATIPEVAPAGPGAAQRP